ncbi:MAG: Gfo/Idh/MocA family oxidoreductase [Anaerolineae bacterium]|nr:Gfo/Idh/MocA family oxidoreductase [Anaerolineae bacterium]
MSAHTPIRLALIGAGIFARDTHLPALAALGDLFRITAVYSRTLANAEALAARLPAPAAASDDLDAVLARDDVEAVNIVLPIPQLPDAVRRALEAGKHVISEKPVAPDVATGRALLDHYAGHADRVWMVGENYRYEPTYLRAAEIVASGAIGRPGVAVWPIQIDMTPSNKYYHTAWRRSNTFPGGFLLDGGVHHAAALRLILGEIASVSAITSVIRGDLPPWDTLQAALAFESGVSGVYSLTYAYSAPWSTTLDIVGDAGALRVRLGALELTSGGATQQIALPAPRGVVEELRAFAAAIRDGAPHRNAPAQAVQDVAVIEAMLRSAETGARTDVARVV